MANVQRKLVHKQFNSPIGLYSDQNVKETLDRELKAFNGNVGIDLNEIPRAAFNIINSSVAKMVAEEDYEKTHPAPRAVNERPSRPRQRRPITREDVLKINRRHPRRRDISWPPSDNHSRSRSSSEEIHFDEHVRKRHEIFHLKEMFDRGAIATTTVPLAKNERNYMRPSSTDEIGSDLDAGSPVGNRGHEMDAQFNTTYQSAKRQSRPRLRCQDECPPRSYYGDNNVNNNAKLSEKTFYLPETELHIGNIEPIRAYWHNISARSSSSPSRYSCSPVRRGGGDELKRWRSHDNITSAHHRGSVSPCNRHLAGRGAGDSHKKDNLPLERNKSNSYNELPPLKPRREDRKDVHHTKKKLNLNNSQQAGRRMWEPGRWISDKSFQLNIQQQTAAHLERCESKSDKRARDNADHNQQANYEMVEAAVGYETSESSCNDSKGYRTITAANHQQPHCNNDQNVNDSAAKNNAINMKRNVSVHFDEQNLSTSLTAKGIPLVSKPESPLKQAESQENDKSDAIPAISKLIQEGVNLNINSKEENYMWNPDEHMAFDGGAGPMSSHHRSTSTENEETESLLLKRILVEEAITQDIHRISEYMKRAEQEAPIADRYANESIAITPLQAILKQIVLPKAFLLARDSVSSTATSAPFPKMAVLDPTTLAAVMQVENMPVVDQVLFELVALSRTLEAFDGTNNSTDNNFHLKEARITELQSDGIKGTDDTTTARVDSISPTQRPRKESESGAELESGPDLGVEVEAEAIDSVGTSSTSRTASATPVDKIIHSKNILSGYLITKQSQEELLKKNQSGETDTSGADSIQGAGMYCSQWPIPSCTISQSEPPISAASSYEVALTIPTNKNELSGHYFYPADADPVDKHSTNAFGTDSVRTANEADYNREQELHADNICDELLGKTGMSPGNNPPPNSMLNERTTDLEKICESNTITTKTNERNDKLTEKPLKLEQQEICQMKNMTSAQGLASQSLALTEGQLHASECAIMTRNLRQEHSSYNTGETCRASDLALGETFPNQAELPPPIIPWRHPEHQYSPHKPNLTLDNKPENSEITSSSLLVDEYNYAQQDNGNATDHIPENFSGYCIDPLATSRRSRCRTRLDSNSYNRFRSTSQPSSSAQYPLPPPLVRQHSLDSSESQFYASPRLYMSGHFTPGKGYKRVAWPPADTAPVYATVPQPQNPPPSSYEVDSQAPQNPEPTNYYQPQQYQQQYQSKPQYQQPQYQQKQYQQAQLNHQPQPTYQSQPQSNYQPQPQYQQPTIQHQQAQYERPQYQQSQSHQPRYEPSSPRQSQPQYGTTPSTAPSSTVSFAGGIARSCSPSRPIARQYIAGQVNSPAQSEPKEQTRQSDQYLSSNQYQAPGQYQQPAQDNFKILSPQSNPTHTSPSQPGPMTFSPLGWSRVRPPTPSRTGYLLQNNPSQYQRTNSVPLGSELYYGAYQSSQNDYRPQATQAFQPVNHEPSGQNYQTQNYNSYQPQQQQQQPQQQQYYTQPQQQRQASPYVRGQSAGVIQLRKETPISQKPAPVYTSHPATATLRDSPDLSGGSNMRGDLKWPPPEYKAQAAVENEERRRIAMGPICRPRRIQKDYSQFFAKNALNHYYPGYKIPPGTQHMYTQY